MSYTENIAKVEETGTTNIQTGDIKPKEDIIQPADVSEFFNVLLEKQCFQPQEKLMPFLGTLMVKQQSTEPGSKDFLEIEFMRYNIAIRLIKISNPKVEPSEIKDVADKMMLSGETNGILLGFIKKSKKNKKYFFLLVYYIKNGINKKKVQ